MKRILLILFLFCQVTAYAQQRLFQSKHTSTYTYIYSLSNKEVLELHKQGKQLNETYLHTLKDSFRVGQPFPHYIRSGNYATARVIDNKLEIDRVSLPLVYSRIVNNGKDFVITLHDTAGVAIQDATVQVDKRVIHYDAATHSWRINNFDKKARLLQITYKGILSCQYLTHTSSSSRTWIKIRNFFRRHFRFRKPSRRREGFIVFNKPIYKPGDTVRFKVYTGSEKEQPLTVKLQSGYSTQTDTVLTVIKPYRPGFYAHEFALSPGLKLQLNSYYRIALEAREQQLLQSSFSYREYELHAINFSARTDKQAHTNNESPSLYLKARDENDMAVMDGRVEIKILTKTIQHYGAAAVFVPDVLWHHETTMDKVGETKILIPDSIFPKASIGYIIHCDFRNTNNELKTAEVQQEYFYKKERFKFKQAGDSLRMTYTESGESIPQTATLITANSEGNTISSESVTLPAVIRIQPYVTAYTLVKGRLTEKFRTEGKSPFIEGNTRRTKDSVFIEMNNPSGLSFWYSIFSNSRIKHRGYGNTLSWKAAAGSGKIYSLSVQYIWAGKVETKEYSIVYNNKELNVSIDAPASVYPGQQTQLNITVTDANDKPVPDADITAYAFTSKFGINRVTNFPYNHPYYYSRWSYEDYITTPWNNSKSNQPLNWEKWKHKMGLDSILHFQFRHPDTVFRYYEPSPLNETEIAPFVMGKGDVLPVHLLFINEQPVYFSHTEQLKRYSFPVKPGWNKISMRTAWQHITYDSVYIIKGVKNILSIDTAVEHKYIHIERRKPELNKHELAILNNYIIGIGNSFSSAPAYIKQYDKLFWLNHNGYRSGNYLVGPVTSANAELFVTNSFTQSFNPEGGYVFRITPGLIKQKKDVPLINASQLRRYDDLFPDLSAHMLRENEIRDIARRNAENDIRVTNLSKINYRYYNKLVIRLQSDTFYRQQDILQYIIYNEKELVSYAGTTRNFGIMPAGAYKMAVMMRNDEYFETDSFIIRGDGVNYYDLPVTTIRSLDINSKDPAIVFWLKNKYEPVYSTNTTVEITRPPVRATTVRPGVNPNAGLLNGKVLDDTGEALPGVTIMLAGTSRGTVTDPDGNFSLRIEPQSTLIISYIGYEHQEIPLQDDSYLYVVLTPVTMNLSEVVVTALGVQREKRSLSYSVSATVKAKNITGEKTTPAKPLIILDGLPFNGKLEAIPESTIVSVKRLSGEEATDLYGTKAAAGVIIITTNKPDITSTGFDAGSMRTNFHDDAFWQPRLRTDANGKATFNVKFPDDITNWQTNALVITDKKQSGFVETKIPSFKLLSANLGLPRFAVEGDTVNVIAKALNYMQETITVNRLFAVNDSIYKNAPLTFSNTGIDTFAVAIRLADSVAFKYMVKKDAYADGEEKKIPVIEQGTIETKGFFASLYKDTSFVFTPLVKAPVKVFAETAVLPVLEDEIRHVQHYEYLCNEQLASKLKAFLTEKKMRVAMGQPFKGEKDIAELISRLEKGKNKRFWGWWPNSPFSFWISRHVMEALFTAEEMGYQITLNKQEHIDYIMTQLNNRQETDTISSLLLLAQLKAAPDYKSYIDSFYLPHRRLSDFDRFRLLYLQQQVKLPADLSYLLSQRNHTLFGNTYWGKDSYYIVQNSIQETLLAYKILRAAGGYEEELQKIRGYFLEERKTGHWRNTYESSMILETILPDVMKDQHAGVTELTVNDITISKFPYTATFSAEAPVHFSKKGKMPVYLTAYQQYQQRNPEKLSAPFSVSSGAGKITMTAGQPFVLTVAVDITENADYVLVEIPIPAGCSYNNEDYGSGNNEMHREYYKHKVSIFCSTLTKGVHLFNVSLLPKYTGVYHLNPAKAELQYFPVFMGREGIKKVSIR